MAILSVTTGIPSDRDPYSDYVYRHQVEAFNKVDESTQFKFTDIEIEAGPKGSGGRRPKAMVRLRYAMDSAFLFAVYGDNPELHSLDRDEWESAARNALEKFTAGRNFQIKSGPTPEFHNRYNLGVELAQRIEINPATIAKEQEVAAARAKIAAEEAEARRIRQLLGVQGGRG